MSNYTKGQIFANLADSDADPTVFDTEFSSVATASATKADKTGTTFTGAIVVPAGAVGAQAPQAQEVLNHSFPVGTKMAFFQATAPTGWTQDVTNNDAILRVVSTLGGGTGGTDSLITGLTATDGHVLTISELPAHTHTQKSPYHAASSNINSGNIGVSGSSAPNSASGSTGGDAAHTHTISFAPKYLDVIVCTKD